MLCVTKHIRNVLTKEGLEIIKDSFETVAKKMNFKILEFKKESNHVHAAIEYPPKLSIFQIVNHLKGVSSRIYGTAEYKKLLDTVLWSPSYFVASVGCPLLEVLKVYIRELKVAH